VSGNLLSIATKKAAGCTIKQNVKLIAQYAIGRLLVGVLRLMLQEQTVGTTLQMKVALHSLAVSGKKTVGARKKVLGIIIINHLVQLLDSI